MLTRTQLTAADLKLYTLYLKFDEMYAADGKNPFQTRSEEFPKLAKIIEALKAGRAGDYARTSEAPIELEGMT